MTDPGQPAGEQVPRSPSGATSVEAAGEAAPPVSSSVARMPRFTAANMLRSLRPLVLICLVLVAIPTLRAGLNDPVRVVDTTSSERASAELASYPLLVPRGLPDQWRPTSVRTNAGSASAGDPVTLQIGYVTPTDEYAAYVTSDDRQATALTDVLATATDAGTQDVDGETWQRRTTPRGETVLTRDADGATLLVTGSAADDELTTLAASLEPYGP